MAEMYTWIVFHAHPTAFIKEEDFHPDYFGTFVCPALRTEPELLLKELLGNQQLSMTNLNSKQLKSKVLDWGLNERLKKDVDNHGYGLNLIKMHARPVEVD
jgi:hypothetical protein